MFEIVSASDLKPENWYIITCYLVVSPNDCYILSSYIGSAEKSTRGQADALVRFWFVLLETGGRGRPPGLSEPFTE